MNAPRTTCRRINDFIIVVVFIVSITAPLAVMTVRPKAGTVGNENRRAAPWPPAPDDHASWEQFPTEVTNWFNDRVGFRNWAIRYYNLATVVWLRSPMEVAGARGPTAIAARRTGSPSSARPNLVKTAPPVIAGLDGWLFLNRDGCLDGCRVPFSDEELDAWERALCSYEKTLSESSAKLLVVVVPDKQSIYQDKLPEEVQWTNSRSRLQQFVELFQKDVDILDLRQLLLTARAQHDVYFRHDTHWNELGAFLAYQAIIRRVGLEPLSLADIEIVEEASHRDDLSKMLELTQSENAPTVRPRLGFHSRKIKSTPFVRELFNVEYENSSRNSLRLAVCHDSFFDGFVNPWLAEHFNRTVCVWNSNGPSERVADENPDIVIFELAERYLMHPPPMPFAEPSGG